VNGCEETRGVHFVSPSNGFAHNKISLFCLFMRHSVYCHNIDSVWEELGLGLPMPFKPKGPKAMDCRYKYQINNGSIDPKNIRAAMLCMECQTDLLVCWRF
jgi:hypothetical protein